MHWTVVVFAAIGICAVAYGVGWTAISIVDFVKDVRKMHDRQDYHDRRITYSATQISNLYKEIQQLKKEVEELRVQNTPHNEEDRQEKGE